MQNSSKSLPASLPMVEDNYNQNSSPPTHQNSLPSTHPTNSSHEPFISTCAISDQAGIVLQELSSVESAPQQHNEVSAINTSTQTSIIKPVNNHPMQTRSKLGVFKPKQPFNLNVTRHPLPASIQPHNHRQALTQPHWKQAMLDEYAS